jgi:hypothetical protein
VKWDYPQEPRLSFFQILVSTTEGTYEEKDIRAVIEPTQRHYACAALGLVGVAGTSSYFAVVQAVGFDLERAQVITSGYSNSVCLMVQQGVVYGCPDEVMVMETCEDLPIAGR